MDDRMKKKKSFFMLYKNEKEYESMNQSIKKILAAL